MIDRRLFLKTGLVLSYDLLYSKAQANFYSARIQKMIDSPKIFSLSFIDPRIDSQKNQEEIVSRFPMALVTQDVRWDHLAWKNKVRRYNKDIVFLAYQMVIEETTVPGPGHDILRDIKKSFLEYPGGYQPYILVHKTKKRRIFDPRTDEWKSGFLKACEKVLNSYDYDGLFLDQCTIYQKYVPISHIREEMFGALQDVIQILRNKYPDKIIIANSRYQWNGANGQMNENRRNDFKNELTRKNNTDLPINLGVVLQEKNEQVVKKLMEEVHLYDAWFCSCESPQKVTWYDFYGEL